MIRAGRPVVVPRLTGATDVLEAYRRLRRVGLRMAIPQSFSLGSLCLPSAGAQWPAAGARVAAGATVAVRRLFCAVGSPAAGTGETVVPDLTGWRASAAVGSAARALLYWELDGLAPLRGGARAELLDNYVVTGQSPAGGSRLGRGVDCSSAATRCFRATPLRLRARRAVATTGRPTPCRRGRREPRRGRRRRRRRGRLGRRRRRGRRRGRRPGPGRVSLTAGGAARRRAGGRSRARRAR